MKIAVGSDHAAFDHKQYVVKELRSEEHDIMDFGTNSADPCDYPDIARAVAKAVSSGETERGIIMCGTGLGMCITANKVRGIRAAACHDEYTTIMSRSHNDANVLCLPARLLGIEQALEIVDVWLDAPFEGGRHDRRVEKIMRTEREE